MVFTNIRRLGGVMALLCLFQQPALAQTPEDRTDASLAEEGERDRAPGGGEEILPAMDRPSRQAPLAGDSVLVGAIRIEGATELPPSAFAGVIAAYAGRALSPEDLRALASDVADVARRSGFGLATAWVPRQRSTDGVLKVAIDEGRVDVIEVGGSGSDVVRRMLAPLVDGRPVRTRDLERQLLLAGDTAGLRLGKARLERRDGRNILHVDSVQERATARAVIDNWGTETVGPIRARLALDLNGLVTGGDQLSLGGVMTPLQPSEFQMVRAAYSVPAGTRGTEISVGGYYAHSAPGASLRGRDIEGRSMEGELAIRNPFVRARKASLWGDLAFRLREARQAVAGSRSRDDRLATLSATAFGTAKLSSGRARGRLSLVQGFDVLGATRAGDPLASRRDADGTFSKIQAWAAYQHRFDRRWSIEAQAEAQLADAPLLSSEEMGLGGRTFLRAYDYREKAGDKGVAGSLELRFDLKGLPGQIASGQFYGYADAGSVGNYRNGSGGGSLASAGAGIRAALSRKLEFGAEIGVPLSPRADPADGSKPRFSFTLAAGL